MSIKKQDIHDHFISVYNEYNQPIFRYLAVKIFDREIAKDLLQDVFMRYWTHIDAGGQVEKIKPFLYRIAHNLMVDQIRRKKPVFSLDSILEEGVDFSEGDNPVKSHENKKFAESIIPRLDELEDDYKQILIMRYVDDLSIAEIADILDIQENTISVRLHRAHTKLKNIIKKDE